MLFCKVWSNPTVLPSLCNNLPLNSFSDQLATLIGKYISNHWELKCLLITNFSLCIGAFEDLH